MDDYYCQSGVVFITTANICRQFGEGSLGKQTLGGLLLVIRGTRQMCWPDHNVAKN